MGLHRLLALRGFYRVVLFTELRCGFEVAAE